MAAVSWQPGEVRQGEFIVKCTTVITIETPKPEESEEGSDV